MQRRTYDEEGSNELGENRDGDLGSAVNGCEDDGSVLAHEGVHLDGGRHDLVLDAHHDRREGLDGAVTGSQST